MRRGPTPEPRRRTAGLGVVVSRPATSATALSCTAAAPAEAMVGMNAVVMDEAEIGENSIVAALAFVKAGAVIPPRSLAVGSPARVIRELSDQEIDWKTRGTGVYQRLAAEARGKLAPAAPLAAPEPDRRRARAPDYDPLVVERLKLGD